MTSKSILFAAAWSAARKGAAKFGGSARTYFAQSLKMAYEFFRAQEAKAVAANAPRSTADKVSTLATICMSWSRDARKSFAWKFVMDNADRVSRFGDKTIFSEKQVSIIDEMYIKYAA